MLVLSPLLLWNGVQAEEFATTSGEIEMIQDERKQVDAMISATQEALDRLKALKEYINELKTTEQLCMKHPKDTVLLYKLAQAAHKTYIAIQEAQLEDVFRREFLSELKKLHDIADKKTIPPAK